MTVDPARIARLRTALPRILAELTGDGAEPWAPYTWAGKGWGGAGDDSAPGLDCSGFACGFLRRFGKLNHARGFIHSDGMRQTWDRVRPGDEQPFDVRLFGSESRVSHVGVIIAPGVEYVDSGGGGGSTHPGGSDWPPAKGRAGRILKWSNRTNDAVGVWRVPASWAAKLPEDRDVLLAWVDHVAQYRAGKRPALTRALQAYGYRPMWSRYTY